MSNKLKEIDIKYRTYYFFVDMIKVKNPDPNKIKIDEKSYKNILIYHIGYVTINSLKALHLTINDVNGYLEDSNGNKYLTLVPTDESMKKYEIKSMEELWNKIRNLIKSITNNSDYYYKKHMKFEFHSNDEFPLKKTLELPNTVIVVRSVFHEGNKYYPYFF